MDPVAFFQLIVFGTALIPICGIVLGIMALIFWIHTLIIVMRDETGDARIAWVLVVLFASVLGAAIYRLMRSGSVTAEGKRSFSGSQLVLAVVAGAMVGAVLLCCGLFTLGAINSQPNRVTPPRAASPEMTLPAGTTPLVETIDAPEATATLIDIYGMMTLIASSPTPIGIGTPIPSTR